MSDEILIKYLISVKNSMRYFTVAGYFRYLGYSINLRQHTHWSTWREGYKGTGFMAANICEERNIEIRRVPHKEFGTIGSYPEKVLAEIVFGKTFLECHDL